ncbi:hypothetical protein C8Q77DRAFT_1022876, partial [Trametes polyzona]
DALLYCQMLLLEDNMKDVTAALRESTETLNELKTYVSGNWVLTKAQQELLTGLLGHWLVKPLETYEKIYVRVGHYVHLRAEWLHLSVYVTDPLARQTVDKFLRTTIGGMKSTFCKDVIASLKDQKPLDNFPKAMLKKYHAPIVPATPPHDTLAALALL